ncbi:MAG TPA: hypothetical protein VLV78_01220 [Thermoanaerobaculia bacterium]|nr:hypothetical protein [Thermoanaerobaculia bacterium]
MHILIALMLIVSADDKVLLKAHYTQIEGTDPEYAQGAIEKNDLPHREIARFVWLIQVPAPGDPAEWERRLNASAGADHGSFRVTKPTPEEQRRVDSGEITMQQ